MTYPKSLSVESLNSCSIFNSFNDHSLFICLKKGWYTADRFCKLDRHISTRIKPFMSVKLWLLWRINRINFVWRLDSALLAHFTFNFACFKWSEDYYSQSPQSVNSLKKYSTIPVRALNRNVSTHFCIDLHSHDQFNSILKLFDSGSPKGYAVLVRKESLVGGHKCQSSVKTLAVCQLSVEF